MLRRLTSFKRNCANRWLSNTTRTLNVPHHHSLPVDKVFSQTMIYRGFFCLSRVFSSQSIQLCAFKSRCLAQAVVLQNLYLQIRSSVPPRPNDSSGGQKGGSPSKNDGNDQDDDEEDEDIQDASDMYNQTKKWLLRYIAAVLFFYYMSQPCGTEVWIVDVIDQNLAPSDPAVTGEEITSHDPSSSGEEHSDHTGTQSATEVQIIGTTDLRFDTGVVHNSYIQWYVKDDMFPFSYFYSSIPPVRDFDHILLPRLLDREPNLKLRYRYTSWSEMALSMLYVTAWIFPLYFLPRILTRIVRPVYVNGSSFHPASSSLGSPPGLSNKIDRAKNSVQFRPTRSATTFRDVVGMAEAKGEVQEFVTFLAHPAPFRELGAEMPKGALLLGAPGVGKTLLAKAMAGEARASFIACCGSDFVELYAGMGAFRMRKLFAEAKKNAPCIVYIDEIDAIGLRRTGDSRGAGQEREHTLNQLLAEMDGFRSRHNVIVVASTNAQLEAMDPALVRPGRLDRIIHIDRPKIKERVDLFYHYLLRMNLIPDEMYQDPHDSKQIQHEEYKKHNFLLQQCTSNALLVLDPPSGSVQGSQNSTRNLTAPVHRMVPNNTQIVHMYAKRLAELCPGFSGAEVRNVCNEGGIIAARVGMTFVDIHCFEYAIDRVIAGIELRRRVLSPFEKDVVAHHEAGHAAVAWYLERTNPLMKLSIVPRSGNALGYAQYLPSESSLQSEQALFEDLCVCLGGRAAEDVFFHHLSTGAQDDLSKVWKMARTLVSAFGRIREDTAAAYIPDTERNATYAASYGDTTARRIDHACRQVVDKAYAKAVEILTHHREETALLAQHLSTQEMLTRDDVLRILGARPRVRKVRRQEEEVPILTPISPSHPLQKQKVAERQSDSLIPAL